MPMGNKNWQPRSPMGGVNLTVTPVTSATKSQTREVQPSIWLSRCAPNAPIQPICDSNCANDRLMNLYHGADKELCCAYKENDYSLLKERLLGVYHQIQEQAKHTPS